MSRFRTIIPVNAKKGKPIYLAGILFAASAIRDGPRCVQVLTEMPREENDAVYRYPCYETVLGHRSVVRECRVSSGHADHGRGETFIVAAMWDQNDPINIGLRNLYPVDWRGSILVMKAGSNSYVTNMRAGDYFKAKRALRRYVLRRLTMSDTYQK
ncbi:hypothetical protein EIP86_005633 [Pleurotus ostreatoroseus]|nr:hypothetical protein EIP86_005633 [Pleurotus ostreatoroseus]